MKLRHMAFAVPIFLGVAAVNGYMTRAGSDDLRGKMLVDARQRTYDLHVPTNYDGTKDAPLLIALHGRLGTGSDQQRRGHLDRLGDEFGFLVVYPDGLQRSRADGRGATPSDKSDVDDVKFISALIDTLESKYKVDRSRIYATGMSNGGFMTGRLACDLSDRIAAVAIVGASISENVAADCHPAKPVSALIIQGSEDPLVPFGGALGRPRRGTAARCRGAEVCASESLRGRTKKGSHSRQYGRPDESRCDDVCGLCRR